MSLRLATKKEREYAMKMFNWTMKQKGKIIFGKNCQKIT